MTEAIMHPVPSETTVTQEVSSLSTEMRRYFHRNGDAFLMIALSVGAMFVNRLILRRELKRLQFQVEIFPDDSWGDYGVQRFDDD